MNEQHALGRGDRAAESYKYTVQEEWGRPTQRGGWPPALCRQPRVTLAAAAALPPLYEGRSLAGGVPGGHVLGERGRSGGGVRGGQGALQRHPMQQNLISRLSQSGLLEARRRPPESEAW